MSKLVIVGVGKRSKLRPRGRPFKKGERYHFQFQPGQSGNPGGKPKIHQRLGIAYANLLAQTIPDQIAIAVGAPRGVTWAYAIAQAIIARAVRGDVSAAKEICDVTEGKATARHEVTQGSGQAAQPPVIKFNFIGERKDLK